MQYTDDPYADFLAHDYEQSKWLQSRPECDCCGEHIQEDHYFEEDGMIICPDCWRQYVHNNFYREIE